MDNQEMLRINIMLNPHKDDALYRLLASIPKDARARRLINMASIGAFIESNGRPDIQPVKNNYQSDASANNSSSQPFQTGSRIEPEPEFAEGELDSLASMFDL